MRRPLAAATLLLVLLLAACGGDDTAAPASSEPAPTPSATAAPTPSEPELTEVPEEEPAVPAPTSTPDDGAGEDDAAGEDAAAGDGRDDDAAGDSPADDGDAPDDDSVAGGDAETFELSLNGDGVDGGCSWGVDEDENFYEIVYPAGYAVVGSPATLVDGDGTTVVSEGEGMRVTGRLAPDQTPTCDTGTVLLADAVAPL